MHSIHSLTFFSTHSYFLFFLYMLNLIMINAPRYVMENTDLLQEVVVDPSTGVMISETTRVSNTMMIILLLLLLLL